MTETEVRECHDCGLRQEVEPLEGGSVAHCLRCDCVLRRASRHTELFPLFCACAAAFFFFIALGTPFMRVTAPGHDDAATLFDGPRWFYERGLWPLTIVTFITLILMPAFRLGSLVLVLGAARFSPPPRWTGPLFLFMRRVTPWAMIEVFLLGAAIAYTRLGQLAKTDIEPGAWLLGAVMITLVAAEGTLDDEAIWDATEAGRPHRERTGEPPILCHGCRRLEHGEPGEKCWRCGHTLHERKPNSFTRAWALVLSGFLLYLPANILPVMTVTRLGKGETNTIISGIIELANAHLLPLAILVFAASFVVPLLKLLGMLVLLAGTHFKSARWIVGRTRLYRFIDVIGRWSMIDVFMLSTLVGLVHMGFIGSVVPHWGAVAFGGVVVVTMFAAEAFDPRLMWDAASQESKKEVR